MRDDRDPGLDRRRVPPHREAREPREPRPPEAAPAPPPPAPAGVRLAAVEELEVSIEKLVAGGEGLARFDGAPIFIPRSAPGDRLRVRLVERHPDYGRAEILEILEPGPDRRPDPYPELASTGVADLQHLHDEVQPRLKAQAVWETLAHLGKLQMPGKVDLVTGEPWGYRLRTQLHTDRDPVTRGARVGYLARGTNDVVPVGRCALLVPELDELIAQIPPHLAHLENNELPWRIDAAAGDRGAVTVAPVIPGLPSGEVTTEVATSVGSFTYGYDARCFFQGHRGLLPKLVESVVGTWTGEEAFDLYGGVGLFALPLARRYRRVVAVEGDRIGARYARLNIRRNQAENLEALNLSVETWIQENLPDRADRVVVDPPRSGLSGVIRRHLLERLPERLTYVSCHPAALARDLRLLSRSYRVESLVLFDLFPQTGHMEAVVQMVRTEEPPPAEV